jgi:GTP-binding protein HflX
MAKEIVPVETAKQLASLSRETKRQLGLLVDRRGIINFVLVGDRKSIFIPDLTKYRFSPGHLRGLRLIHTHLDPSGLTREDLTDLILVRLDLIVALEVSPEGQPGRTHLGYLLPSGGSRWTLETFPGPYALPQDPQFIITQAEEDLRSRVSGRVTEGVTRSLLVGWSGASLALAEESMEELKELARTAGIEVTDCVIQPRTNPDPRTIIGKGKLNEVAILALDQGADTLLFNTELSPSQLRAITEATELKVIDRTMLILDIFAQHAKSSGGKIQVELAQLRYLLPHLVGKGTALSRLAGGIGTRGPGETKLEVDRRRIRQRIQTLERSLSKLRKGRATRRRKRGESERPIVSIVGYTNVGKSTLLNSLTQSSEIAESMLLATLDPVSRRLSTREGHLCVLTDTVGLIHDLPPELQRAFAATFEEIGDADMILHLADCSHPNCADQISTVEEIIYSMGLSGIPRMLVLNKSDLMDSETLANLKHRFRALAISAIDRTTLEPLVEELKNRLAVLPGSGQMEPEKGREER